MSGQFIKDFNLEIVFAWLLGMFFGFAIFSQTSLIFYSDYLENVHYSFSWFLISFCGFLCSAVMFFHLKRKGLRKELIDKMTYQFVVMSLFSLVIMVRAFFI